VKLTNGIKYIIGIDEAGRGPLAGPVSVGVCLVSAKMTRKILLKRVARSGLKKLNDSKKLSIKNRELWFEEMKLLKKNSRELDFAVTLISNKIIDEQGLSFAIKKAMLDSLKKLAKKVCFKPCECLVLLDGGLHAPVEFIFQETIIKGDEKEFAISLASIAAKVTRDAHMMRLTKKYCSHGFETNKGYGTPKHISAIKIEGITPIHRVSFLRNII
jgi:ribonuclease HII